MGTIEKGEIANLVLLDANPLEDFKNTTKIGAVLFGGRLFPKTSIVAMLANAQALANRKSIAEALSKTINEKDVQPAVWPFHCSVDMSLIETQCDGLFDDPAGAPVRDLWLDRDEFVFLTNVYTHLKRVI